MPPRALAAALASFVWALAGPGSAAVIVDPGHGGEDLGAVVRGLREKEIALAIARRLKAHLADVPVRLTRDSDVYVPLDERVAIGRSAEAAAFVSLHVNQVRSRSRRGIVVFAYGKSPWKSMPRAKPLRRPPPLPAPPSGTSREGAALARSVVRSLKAEGLSVDPPSQAPFYVLKNPTVPSVLIELGYLTHPNEARLLSNEAYQDRVARALAEGVRAFLARPTLSGGRDPRHASLESERAPGPAQGR